MQRACIALARWNNHCGTTSAFFWRERGSLQGLQPFVRPPFRLLNETMERFPHVLHSQSTCIFLLFGKPSQTTSGEMIVTFPNCCPTNSGCDDGRLFFGTFPKGAPALRGFDKMVCGCGKASVADEGAFATVDYSVMRNKFVTVPQSITQ
jgi:hypothetical protein